MRIREHYESALCALQLGEGDALGLARAAIGEAPGMNGWGSCNPR